MDAMNFVYEKVSVICQKLQEMILGVERELDGFEYAPCPYMGTYEDEQTPPADLAWEPFAKGQRIGGRDQHYWFRTRFATPEAREGKQYVFRLLTGAEGWDALNPQGLVYLNGKLTQGLDVNHTEVLLEPETEYELMVYFYAGMFDGLHDFLPSLCTVDTRVEKLYYDLHVPLEACLYLSRESDEYIKTMKELELALSYLDLRVPGSEEFYRSAEKVVSYLDEHFYRGICGQSEAVVNCIGHTHIDVAWLWTLAQTREKAQRSFATVVNLMRQYPEYRFMSSQPQLYAYVKKAAPELYEEIRGLVREGRWEVEGAMWLEADCNITSGESLVRQILYGKRFMKEEFGVDSRILWLPDVFGYSAALPQILKKSGVDTFVTSKISWNEANKLPCDSFLWQGIDGSEVFTSFMTARDVRPAGENDSNDRFTTYVGYIRPSQVLGTWKRYQQKEFNNEVMLTFGFGDGGGGPTKDMLEQQRRLAYGLPGFPKTQIGFAGAHLERVKAAFDENTALLKRTPRWVGELYMEMHRGTYTSIAKNKKNNRKSELAHQRVETLSAAAEILTGSPYPAAELHDGWQEILLNQFHDIIPGSSIFEVYEDSDKGYARILKKASELQEEKLAALTEQVKTDGGLFVYNPNGFAGSGVVECGGEKVYVEDIPAFGYRVVKEPKRGNAVQAGPDGLENRFFRIRLDEKGEIISLYDKRHGRELVPEGAKANQIQVFEDFPREYDAWEITNYYKQKMWVMDDLTSVRTVDEGARAGIELERHFLDSVLTQRIFLYEDVERIDFDTVIDWKQEHLLVKAAFPLDLYANEATYDIQFGNLKRPTHENTSWDAAKFEVCAHKWGDLSDGGYGVSLLNDCKYGYSAEGSTLKLTLLKSATYPNIHADREVHSFTYSLYPHAGNVWEGGTVQAAYELNQPMLAVPVPGQAGTLPEAYSLVSCDSPHVVVETVKKAEDGDDLIIRLYEAHNRRGVVKLTMGFDFAKACLCDLMEEETGGELAADGRTVTFPVKNYEIVTLRITR